MAKMLRAKEILEEDPSIKQYFDEHQIGFLSYLGFVKVRKIHKGTLYSLEDVRRVVEFKKQVRL